MSQNKGRNSKQKRALKERLFERDGERCCYCKRKLKFQYATLEHVVPLSQGGSWNISNLLLACRRCNFNRGDMSVEDFKAGKRRKEHAMSI